MKRFDEALKIYDYGLKTLDSENQGLQVMTIHLTYQFTGFPDLSTLLTCPSKQIRALRAKLDKAINGTPPQDPFTVFPRELVAQILQYLDLKDLLYTPFPCMLGVYKRYSDHISL